MENLSELIDAYDATKGKLTVTQMSNLFKEIRKTKIRRPDIILACAKKVLNHERGNELWAIYEQIAIAALDTGCIELADEYVAKLVKKFPKSVRVKRLEGMVMEFEGEYTDALEFYAMLLSQNPSNILIMKRKVCVYKANGDLRKQIDELNSILRLYPSESASWLELGEIYISQCEYEDAAHCFEELILLDPFNASYHNRLADVYYSIGGLENLLSARRHYTMSLNAQAAKFNLKALYGLIVTCNSITSINSSSADDKASNHDASVNKELLRWSKTQLEDLQSGNNGNKNELLQCMKSVF